MKISISFYTFLLCLCCLACTGTVKEPVAGVTLHVSPSIYPDYADVTIPPHIAPLRFQLLQPGEQAIAVLTCGGEKMLTAASREGCFLFAEKKWHNFLAKASGQDIRVKIYRKENGEWQVYPAFHWHVSTDPIDDYLVYRLIEPGYELWNKMGIYQRRLSDYEQTPVIENSLTNHNCMNCHSFCRQNPAKMLFHMRAELPGTYIISGKEVEKLDTHAGEKVKSLVYPSWHPSGNLVAFSVNNTRQAFHRNDQNRIEVYDLSSDVVVYDINKHEVVTDSLLFSDKAFETFPTFSPDGKTLYFCSAQARELPKDFKSVKYSLCSIAFDPATRRFGSTVDTLYNTAQVGTQADGTENKSASFPRVSPDGKYLVFTLSEYGNFSIWHKDADLYKIDLSSGALHRMDGVNSEEVESYHSWSSNSRWLVFSSRRGDGLYTRPYMVHIDEEGKAGKPFVLPQETPDFYSRFMYSYNIPEFVKGRIEVESHDIAASARKAGSKIGMR